MRFGAGGRRPRRVAARRARGPLGSCPALGSSRRGPRRGPGPALCTQAGTRPVASLPDFHLLTQTHRLRPGRGVRKRGEPPVRAARRGKAASLHCVSGVRADPGIHGVLLAPIQTGWRLLDPSGAPPGHPAPFREPRGDPRLAFAATRRCRWAWGSGVTTGPRPQHWPLWKAALARCLRGPSPAGASSCACSVYTPKGLFTLKLTHLSFSTK